MGKPIIGIRREDKSVWERRVPLVPGDIHHLRSQHGIDVVVQSSETRAFSDEEFVLAGARVEESLSSCPIVFAIKEVPAEALEADKTYAFFAHVIKGQPHNMPMLRRLLELGCTLIDYEKVTDEQGRRLVFFGRQAGWAGMVDTLWALGQRLKWEGTPNPFQALHPMPAYGDLSPARAALEVVGKWIQAEGLPHSVAPLVIGIAGYGNVSGGVQEIVDLLPTVEIDPLDLPSLARGEEVSRHHIYKVVFKEQHLVEPVSPSGRFELNDYYHHPEKYAGVFARYLPHLTVLINAIYWAPQYPRLVTKADLRELFAAAPRPALRVIGDISCDIEGAIEATIRSTDPGSPIYVYDPGSGEITDGYAGPGPVIMAVDILPSELPRESSTEFSQVLRGFVPGITGAEFSAEFADLDLPSPIKRAVISHRGELTPDYRYLAQFLEKGI
jgi:alpha-aminoadipic semialdehyde synthase